MAFFSPNMFNLVYSDDRVVIIHIFGTIRLVICLAARFLVANEGQRCDLREQNEVCSR